MRILKYWWFLILIFSSLHATSSLKERLIQAKPGDYIVTSQGNHYSLLVISSLTPTQLILEEITIPSSAIDSKISWKEWVLNRAPGNTSWIAYTFDLENNRLIKCYSYTQRQWLFIDQTESLFAKLLALPLRSPKEYERKRIGPPPAPGETDRRKLWLPSVIRAGQKEPAPHFEILKGKWPNDKTRMASCDVELYFDAGPFPLPYWLEIQGAHYTFKLQTVDSGTLPLPLH